MSSTHLYTYGVVADDEFEVDETGVDGGTPVRTVSYRNLSAVVTDIDTLEPEQTDENSQAHDDVLRAVMESGEGRTVVPMQFGMTFKNGRTLKSVLRGGRRAFTRALHDVEGMVELGVKLVADEGATLDREAIRSDVADRLLGVAERDVENDRFSDRLVLNRSYLVDREQKEAFSEVVGAIREEYGEELTVQYSGPYAPYNFVDIEIGAKQ